MKNPKEYLNHFGIIGMEVLLSEMIKEVQKDAYNQAIEDVLNNVSTVKEFVSTGDYSGYERHIIDKNSILKFKIK